MVGNLDSKINSTDGLSGGGSAFEENLRVKGGYEKRTVLKLIKIKIYRLPAVMDNPPIKQNRFRT